MEKIDNTDAYQWLSAAYRTPPCTKCNGRSDSCERCGGTGRGAPVFSRTDAIRRAQECAGHRPCFGVLGKRRRDRNEAVTPATCEEPECPYRRSCVGLHLNSRYHSDRIREESVEYLSRLFLNARAIERRTPQLTLFQADTANLIAQWIDDTPQVAVLGAFSAGKSTLLNRLLEKSLLPATRTPTTAVVTSIRFDSHAHGILYFRTFARLTLLSQDARSPDPEAVKAMLTWLISPEDYGIRQICEVDEHGNKAEVDRAQLRQELEALETSDGSRAVGGKAGTAGQVVGVLKCSIGKRVAPAIERLTRTFEVHFTERQPLDMDLTIDANVAAFGCHLTEPSCALALTRAVCYLPNSRLRSLNFLDTAGLCSPVVFHKDVTAEFLKRRPDKILVLLDARRLDSPTNREALKMLGRFVSVPDDYRQVTFVLTFWDLALRTHMLEDSEPELDFDSYEVRSLADRRFARNKRKELTSFLSSSVGIACESEPVIFTLGLGPQAPPEMRSKLDALWKHLENDCGGWVGVEMWAERWRAARGYSQRLTELHKDTAEEVEEAAARASDSTDVKVELARLDAQEKSVTGAVARTETNLRELLEAQKKRMLAEVACLDSKSSIISYLDSGYWKSANASLNALQDESKQGNAGLVDLYRRARALRSISLDRKLFGLDASVREQAKEEVSGFLYGLKSVWDFLFGSVVELNESNRSAAREILRGQVRSTIDLLEDAVDDWSEQAERISQQAFAEYADKREELSARQADLARFVEGLQRKLRFLYKCESPLRDLCDRVTDFANCLGEAKARIEASRQADFRAILFTDNGARALRKGREQDLLLLSGVGKSRWKCLEIRGGGWSRQFLPVARSNGKGVTFITDDGTGSGKRGPVVVPDHASRFEMWLSTLEGRFI